MSLVLALLFGWRAMLGHADPPVHWTARYRDATGEHRVEAWRVPGHVRRISDGVLELDATRPPSGGYQFTLHDRRSDLRYRGDEHTRILQRSFDDWERWTHVVTPSGPRALARPTARTTATPAGRCAWFVDGTREICWSRSLALPLLVRVEGQVVYQVTQAAPFHGVLASPPPRGIEVGGDDD
jgi:hypothetical protein